jgi:hypothetical protein
MMDGEGTTSMSKAPTVTLALAAGLVGGLLSRYVAPPSAFAQDKAKVTKEVRAQSFTLVDPSDHAVGTFTFEPGPLAMSPNPIPFSAGGRVILRDSNGREIWSAGYGVQTPEPTKK